MRGMLIMITLCKAIDQMQLDAWQKRRGCSAVHLTDESTLTELLSRKPSPRTAMAMNDELNRPLALLDDDGLRHLVLLKLEGHNNSESAQALGCVRVTLQRMLRLMRQTWEPEVPR